MKQILRLIKSLFSPPNVEYPPYPLLYWEELPNIASAEAGAHVSEDAPIESIASCQVQASYYKADEPQHQANSTSYPLHPLGSCLSTQ